jgi:lipopolysaccharide transport system permease protein
MSTLVIEAGRSVRQYWKDIWRYRELFYILAWRDVAVRYKQTVIGIVWAFLRPLLTMLIFALVFGKIANLPSEGVPYTVYVFSGTLAWSFFSSAFSSATSSLVSNAHLVSKVYFPRLILPVASVAVAMVDLLVSYFILLGLLAYYGLWPHWTMFALVPFTLIAAAFALGAGLLFGSLNVKYRDIGALIPFLIQVGTYASPVGYGSITIPEKYRLYYYLNPMAGVIDGFRWSVSGGQTQLDLKMLGVSCVVTLATCLVGWYYFRQTERQFADVI